MNQSLLVVRPGANGAPIPCTVAEVNAGLGSDAVAARTWRNAFGLGNRRPTDLDTLETAVSRRSVNAALIAKRYPWLAGAVIGQILDALESKQTRLGTADLTHMQVNPATQLMNYYGVPGQDPGCVPPVTMYNQPATAGAAPIRGEGFSDMGFHLNTAGTSVGTTVAPRRPCRVTRFDASADSMDNWRFTQLEIDADPVLHGNLAPLGVLDPEAAYPIPWDLALGTSDNVSITSQQLVAAVGTPRLQISGSNCYNPLLGLGYPCAPMGKGSLQVIIGLGAAQDVTENGGVATLTDTPDTPVRMGRLNIVAVMNGTAPTSVPTLGMTITNGQEAGAMIGVTQVDINGVKILATANANGAIGARKYHPKSGALFFPNIALLQSDNINVALINRSPVAGMGATNTIRACGAVVGAERLAVC